MKAVLWTIIGLCFATVACTPDTDHGGRTPLVEAGGHWLYVEDLKKVLPSHLSKDDSTLFAEHYIRNWIEEQLLLENAQRNIPEDGRLQRLVENYRQALILHAYEQRMVEQKLSREIPEEEIDSFYRVNHKQFVLERPLVKGLYIKVPLKAAGLNRIREWYRKKDSTTVEKIEKYTLQHAADYRYFYDRWTPLSEVMDKTPLERRVWEREAARKYVELKDTLFHYFIHIDTMLTAGGQMPVEYAKDEIRETLMNARRGEFMKRIRNELYQEALENGEIEYYY